MPATASFNAKVVAALVAVQVLFGINYVTSKYIVASFPPLVWASIRITFAALAMTVVATVLRRGHAPSGRKFFLPLIVYSLFGITLNQTAFLTGIHYTTATNAAILNTLIPVFTLMIVTARGQESFTRRRMAGFIFSFAGVLVLRKVEQLRLSDQTLIGDLLIVANSLCYAVFLSCTKTFLEKNDRVWTTAWMFIYGSVGICLMSVPQWTTFQPPLLTPSLAACMAFGVVGGTLATYFFNIWALAKAKPSSVALFVYLQPVVTAALATVWLGEQITLRTVFSSLMIFSGLVLALRDQIV